MWYRAYAHKRANDLADQRPFTCVRILRIVAYHERKPVRANFRQTRLWLAGLHGWPGSVSQWESGGEGERRNLDQ